jgi:hypothetical protein
MPRLQEVRSSFFQRKEKASCEPGFTLLKSHARHRTCAPVVSQKGRRLAAPRKSAESSITHALMVTVRTPPLMSSGISIRIPSFS